MTSFTSLNVTKHFFPTFYKDIKLKETKTVIIIVVLSFRRSRARECSSTSRCFPIHRLVHHRPMRNGWDDQTQNSRLQAQVGALEHHYEASVHCHWTSKVTFGIFFLIYFKLGFIYISSIFFLFGIFVV